MNHIGTCLAALALGSGLALAAEPASSSTDQKVAELTDLVTRLQGEINDMKAATGEDWLTEERAEEIRDLVQDVLADADTRASLLQSGLTAGYDNGFFLASSDGNFSLKLKGQIQVRYVFNHQTNPPTTGGNDGDQYRDGFEIRRAKLAFEGNVVDPSWEYEVKGAFERSGGDFVLEDAWIQKDLENGWKIKVGQFKPPFMREELVSSSAQTAVDRSLVNERFNQDFSQGVQVSYRNDQFSIAAMYNDGVNQDNTAWNAYTTEYSGAARAEVLLSGDWKQFKDFEGWRGAGSAAMLGGGVLYQRAEYGTSAGPEEGDFRATVDATLKFDGASLYAAFVYQDLDVANTNPWGFVVQGGYFLTDDIEVFARYEFGDSDDNTTDLSVITAGFNRFWAKHNLKWSTDLGIGLNQVTSEWASTGVGWRADSPGNKDQLVFRSQLQLLF